MEDMERILRKLNLEASIPAFEREKITPDIVAELSCNEMRSLGIINTTDVMKLRVECISFGGQTPAAKNKEPRYNISKDVLLGLIESGFSVLDMSRLLSVSKRTIFRRMSFYNLRVYSFTDIDDQSLDSSLQEVVHQFPRCGEVMILQILKTKGIKVTRSRLGEHIRRIDVGGIQERSKRRLHRRIYSVSSPNQLWHIDTNHKHFIIAGGIDGFSRFVVFLKCINNNKAQTLLECF